MSKSRFNELCEKLLQYEDQELENEFQNCSPEEKFILLLRLSILSAKSTGDIFTLAHKMVDDVKLIQKLFRDLEALVKLQRKIDLN